VKEFLFPQSVSVVGASPGPKSIGVQFYRGVSQLPEAPELVAATPADAAPRVVDEAGQAGAKAAIVVSGGFAEVGRRDLEEGLVKSARRHG